MVGAKVGSNEVDKHNHIVYNKDLYRRNTYEENTRNSTRYINQYN